MSDDYIVEESRPTLVRRKIWMTGLGCRVTTRKIFDIKMKTVYEHVVLDYDSHHEEPLTFFLNSRKVSAH